jgi:hypothetical protein
MARLLEVDQCFTNAGAGLMTLGALGGEFHRGRWIWSARRTLAGSKMEQPWHNESSSYYVALYSQVNRSY